jgi:hypothetical protein
VTGSPATYGAETSLVFSTSVASGHGEGIPNADTVTVTQGATTVCTVTLTSGSGTCSPTSTTVLAASGSPNTVNATFNSTGADLNFVSTATKTASVTVNPDITVTTVSESPTSVTYGNESASVITASVVANHGEVVPNSETATVNVGSTSCTVTLTGGTGTCTIANTTLSASATAYTVGASYGGDSNLSSSTGSAVTNLTVTKASQTVTFTTTAPSNAAVAGTYTAAASATSGLTVAPLTIDATSSTVCSISSGLVTFNAAGTCTIDANQSGGTNYNAAPQAQQTFTVYIGKLLFTTPAASGSSSATPNLGAATGLTGMTVQRVNGAGAPITTGGALTVNLSSSSSGGKFGASQFTATNVTAVSIGSVASTATFWYGDSNTGSPTITASATNYVSGTQAETVTPAPAGLKLVSGTAGTLNCGIPSLDVTTCTVTGLVIAGSVSFNVEFVDASGAVMAYSASQASTIAATGTSPASVSIPSGALPSTTAFSVGYLLLTASAQLKFGPYILNVTVN